MLATDHKVYNPGEIRNGIERARPRDPARAEVPKNRLVKLNAAFGERVLPIDRAVTDEWGRMSALRQSW